MPCGAHRYLMLSISEMIQVQDRQNVTTDH